MCKYQPPENLDFGAGYLCPHSDWQNDSITNLCVLHHLDFKAKEKDFISALYFFIQKVEADDEINFLDLRGFVWPKIGFSEVAPEYEHVIKKEVRF